MSCLVDCHLLELNINSARQLSQTVNMQDSKAKGSDTLESFLSKVTFESDFRKKSCTCAMKTFAIFLLLKETFTIRTCSILASFFCKLLSKATFERKLSSVSLALVQLDGVWHARVHQHCTLPCHISPQLVHTVSYISIHNHANLTNVGIWGGQLVYPLPSPIRAKFGMQEYTHGICLHAKVHAHRFTVLALRGENCKF